MGKDKCRINTKQALKDELKSSEAIWQLSDSSIDDAIHEIEQAAEWPPNTISKDLINVLRTKVDGYDGYYYVREILHRNSSQYDSVIFADLAHKTLTDEELETNGSFINLFDYAEFVYNIMKYIHDAFCVKSAGFTRAFFELDCVH